MKKLIERYELLSKDIKHQIAFVDDVYDFDFTHLNGTLKEMEKLQKKIKQKQFGEYEARSIGGCCQWRQFTINLNRITNLK